MLVTCLLYYCFTEGTKLGKAATVLEKATAVSSDGSRDALVGTKLFLPAAWTDKDMC